MPVATIGCSVHIQATIRGAHRPPLHASAPPVMFRTGVDIHPVDLHVEDDVRWLEALIWPEHADRRQLFQQAVRCFQRHPVELIQGDGTAMLPKLYTQIPPLSALCIFHTHVANQLTSEAKANLIQNIEAISVDRDVFHIYNNMQDSLLYVDHVRDRKTTNMARARTDGHGRWSSKFQVIRTFGDDLVVAPHTGAWIEIVISTAPFSL